MEDLLNNLFFINKIFDFVCEIEEIYFDYDKVLWLVFVLNELICNVIEYGLGDVENF